MSSAPIKAMAALEAGPKLSEYEFTFEGPVGDDEVEMRVVASGCCHSDVHEIMNVWGASADQPGRYPLIPGHEIVGIVTAIGSKVGDKFKIGDRGAIGAQRGSCKSCPDCDDDSANTCPKIQLTYGAGPDGKPLRGGYAAAIRFPADWVFHLPEELPSDIAAPLMCAGITVYSPLKKVLGGGKKVGILGMGGLGHLAVQYAVAMGNHVTVISRNDSKKADAEKFGAEGYLAMDDADAVAAAQRSFDFILNTASANFDINAYLALLKGRGELCSVGLPEANKPFTLVGFSVLPGRALSGSLLGRHSEYKEMLEFSAKHKCYPQIERLPFNQAQVAIDKMLDNTVRYRSVLILDEEHSSADKQ